MIKPPTYADPDDRGDHILASHLNTPRFVADQNGNAVWRWDQTEAFGDAPPNDNPSGIGAFEFNLRSPGQYADQQMNGFYNYFRDYDQGTGRYRQSDPVGLAGGANTFSYVLGNPIRYVDPLGLYCLSEREINAMGGAAGGALAGGATLFEAAGIPGLITGALLGAGAGAAVGYLGTPSEGTTMGIGAAAGGLTSMNSPLLGAVGGSIGAGVQYNVEQMGVRDTQAGVVGGAVGGAIGGGAVTFLGGRSFLGGVRTGGAIGLASSALAAAVIEALRAGNDCRDKKSETPCEKK